MRVELTPEEVKRQIAASVSSEGRAFRRVAFGKHRFGHVGESARRRWRTRRDAKISRASRQKNRRLAR